MTHEEFLKNYLDNSGPGSSKVKYNGEWIHSQYFTRKTGLSPEEYYESLVPRSKCHNNECDNLNSFNKFSRGWHLYCSRSCQARDRSINMWTQENEKHQKCASKRGYEFGQYNIRHRHAKNGRTTYVYIVTLDSKTIKIGCSYDINRILGYKSPILLIKEFQDGVEAFETEYNLLKVSTAFIVEFDICGWKSQEVRSIECLSLPEFKLLFE